MRMHWSLLLGLAGLSATTATATATALLPRLHLVPAVYDPLHTGKVGSLLLPFGARLAALVLWKDEATTVDAAAGATIDGVSGRTLDQLGFDVWSGGHCGAGAPRYDVTLSDGSEYFFVCAGGAHTKLGGLVPFERVRFSDADAQPVSGAPWPGFGQATLADVEIIFDEGTDGGSGLTALDAIDINGATVGR